MKNRCNQKMKCENCNGLYPTILHDDEYRPKRATNTRYDSHEMPSVTSHCLNCNDNGTRFHSLIVPVEIHHTDNPHDTVRSYALLDEQSDACFVTDSVLDKLNVTGLHIKFKLSTVLAEELVSCENVSGLVVRGINESTEIPLPGCYSRNSIPAKESQISQPNTVQNWPHLRDVADQLMPYDKTMEVGLLIGINCIRAIKPRNVINGNDDEPYAMFALLNYTISLMPA